MRDLALLRFTLQAIRDLGEGVARVVQIGHGDRAWYAGPQPLNGQALQDLLADGWLQQDAKAGTLRLDAWPSFATSTGGDQHG